MKCFVNWIPLRIRIRSTNTQHYFNLTRNYETKPVINAQSQVCFENCELTNIDDRLILIAIDSLMNERFVEELLPYFESSLAKRSTSNFTCTINSHVQNGAAG